MCSDLLISQRQHRLIFNHKAKLKEPYSYSHVFYFPQRWNREQSGELRSCQCDANKVYYRSKCLLFAAK